MKLKPYPQYKPSGVKWIGDIPEHWEVKRLKFVARLAYGESLPDEKREDGDFLVFGSNGVVGSHLSAVTCGHSVVIGRKGSFGKVVYVDAPCYPIDTTYFIDKRYTKSSLKWLYFLLQALELDKFSRDSAVPGLNRESTHNKLAPYFSIAEQTRIAKFLDREISQTENLIEKYEKLIDLLKEKRTALISQVVTKGLNPNVKMKGSGIEWVGEIPEHWSTMKLIWCMESYVDYRGKTPEKSDDGVFLITAKNVKDGKINYEISQEYIPKEILREVMGRGKARIGDVLFTTEAPLGEVAQTDREDIALAQRIIKLRGKKGLLDNKYLKYLIMSKLFQFGVYRQSTGSTVLGLKGAKFKQTELILPDVAEQKQISAYLSSETSKIDALIEKISKQVKLLKEHKTSLISQVVTGKVDVRGVVE